jgi:putative N-acetylmannosamine-6-phosphate epimerase
MPDQHYVLKIFENLYVEDRVIGVDDATAGLAGWIAEKAATLTDDDFALLTAVGAVLFSKGAEARMEVPQHASTAANILIDGLMQK